MHSKLKALLLWGVLFGIPLLLEDFLPYRQFLLKLLPISTLKLSRDVWLGLGLTFTASLLAWLVGVVGGLALGSIVGASLLDTKKHSAVASIGTNIHMAFEALYVVPFVLTVSLFYALTFEAIGHGVLPRWSLAIVLIGVAGLTLGAYNVYRTVYSSVTAAKEDNRLLTGSLYFQKDFSAGRLLRRLSRVSRLRDCEIQGLWAALEQSAHLSIVAVMIVEAVVPHFYEVVFPSNGFVEKWRSGAGGMIFTAQHTTAFEEVAGVIWAVLLFDLIFTWTIDFFCKHRWRKYYGA